MDLFAPRHLLIILVIALVVFGGKKLKTLGSDLGGAVRGFKQAMKEGEADQATASPAPTREQPQAELAAPAAAAGSAEAKPTSSSNAQAA